MFFQVDRVSRPLVVHTRVVDTSHVVVAPDCGVCKNDGELLEGRNRENLWSVERWNRPEAREWWKVWGVRLFINKSWNITLNKHWQSFRSLKLASFSRGKSREFSGRRWRLTRVREATRTKRNLKGDGNLIENARSKNTLGDFRSLLSMRKIALRSVFFRVSF